MLYDYGGDPSPLSTESLPSLCASCISSNVWATLTEDTCECEEAYPTHKLGQSFSVTTQLCCRAPASGDSALGRPCFGQEVPGSLATSKGGLRNAVALVSKQGETHPLP